MHSSPQSMPSNHSDTPSNFKENSHEDSAALLDAISHYTDKKKKPKRNRSAFILFSIDKRSQVNDPELESLNPNDKFVKIAELWKGLNKEERKIYEDKAKQEKNRYNNELNDFCKIFPAEPIQRPRNHIKKPCNAYGYYLKDIKEEIRQEFPALRMCEVLRIVGERWKNLEPEKKVIFERKAEADRQNFKLQMSKQPQYIGNVGSTKGKVSNVKEEDDLDFNSPKAAKQVKMSEIINEVKALKTMKSSETKPSEKNSSHKASVSSLSPVHESENVRETYSKPIILQTPQQSVDLPTRKSSFASINNSYSTANTAFTNYTASPPVQENNLNSNAKFIGLLDMYLKVDLLRQNIFMQLQNMSANNGQTLPFGNIDQINNPVLGQFDNSTFDLLSKINKISPEDGKIKREDA